MHLFLGKRRLGWQMRDILFKNSTSLDCQRRDILLSEHFMRKGVTVDTQKHFIYSIRDHAILADPQALEVWIKKYVSKGPHLKSLSVLKNYNSKLGIESFEVKIAGNLYVLREQDIFNVDFTQIFKIDRKGESLKGLKK